MIVSVDQMKAMERRMTEEGVSYLQLMEQAGSAAAERIWSQRCEVPAVILCGSGNNGGDGFVIARRLAQRLSRFSAQADVTVVLCCGAPKTEQAKENFSRLPEGVRVADAAQNWEQACAVIARAKSLVDCIFGTGFHGAARGTAEQVLLAANAANAERIAIDLPSGLSGDGGAAQGTVFHAHQTIALGAYKPVHADKLSSGYCGKLFCADIGIHEKIIREIYEELGLSLLRPRDYFSRFAPVRREKEANKGSFGKLLLICGSFGMGGAALLSTKAALRCGAGLVRLATVQENIPGAYASIPEAVTVPLRSENGTISALEIPRLLELAGQSDAVVFGCGVGQSLALEQLLFRLLSEYEGRLLLDADGLNLLAKHMSWLKGCRCAVTLTPHPGEMSRLTGKSIAQIQMAREQTAAAFVKEYPCTLVLKGHQTVVAAPSGILLQNDTGNPGMARGGSGDVLAGMIGSLLAQDSYGTALAAPYGVYLHGLAGDLAARKKGELCMTPGDLIRCIPQAYLSFPR